MDSCIIAASITAGIEIRTFKKSIAERKLDLLWRQANAAKEFVHEIHNHESSGAAILMLDWYVIKKVDKFDIKRIIMIKYEEVLAAIPKIAKKEYNDQEQYILDCFDWFFYYIDRAEQNILDGLFRFENIKFVFYPYYKKIALNRDLYELFTKERCYLLASKFWKRFEEDPTFKNC